MSFLYIRIIGPTINITIQTNLTIIIIAYKTIVLDTSLKLKIALDIKNIISQK